MAYFHVMSKKTFKIVTLGCRSNQYESQAFADQLRKRGFVEAKVGAQAELCIVNTCTVTKGADQKSLYQIRKLAREFTPGKLIVTGCLAARKKEEVLSIEGVTHVISNQEKEDLLPLIFPEEKWGEFQIERFEAHTRAFVKIQDGCNSYCSYCIIPFVRGRSRSKSIPEILNEIEVLVENGYKEVVLTGINIGDFDGKMSPPTNLSELVKQIDCIPGLRRLRLSSIDPDEVSDELVDILVSGKTTCPSMHLVLQSGSDHILKQMRRKYLKEDFLNVVARFRKINPRFTFTTDVIVGFPGESEEDFLQTLDVIKETQFAKVHMFPYSDRPKTRSSRMENKIDSETILDRKRRLFALEKETAADLRKKYVGAEMEILVENETVDYPGYFMGHSDNFLPVYIPKKGVRSNELILVKCIENQNEGLVGERVT